MGQTNIRLVTPKELEALIILNEECSEVQKCISKIIRHGYESFHPNTYTTNRTDLANELADLLYSVGMFVGTEVNVDTVGIGVSTRGKAIKQYLHHDHNLNHNWIKKLIHHRDTTIGLIATDREPSYHAERILKLFVTQYNGALSTSNQKMFQKGIETYLKNITFKID